MKSLVNHRFESHKEFLDFHQYWTIVWTRKAQSKPHAWDFATKGLLTTMADHKCPQLCIIGYGKNTACWLRPGLLPTDPKWCHRRLIWNPWATKSRFLDPKMNCNCLAILQSLIVWQSCNLCIRNTERGCKRGFSARIKPSPDFLIGDMALWRLSYWHILSCFLSYSIQS